MKSVYGYYSIRSQPFPKTAFRLHGDSKFFALGNLSVVRAGETRVTRGLFLHGTSVCCVFGRPVPCC